MSVFRTTLLDDTNQPNLVIGGGGRLSWTLFNSARNPEQTLEVTPFSSGEVGEKQYHFKFDFTPGALIDAPTLKDVNVDPSKRLTWDVAVKKDGNSVSSLYIALSGKTPLQIPAGGNYQATLTDVHAVQSDAHQSTTAVKLAAGGNVKLAGTAIAGEKYGPFDLTLVRSNTSAGAPLEIDFIGRRTVLNDGKTKNTITFAVTNMMLGDLPLTPESDPQHSATTFHVWFNSAPKADDPSVSKDDPSAKANWPWALARIDHITNFELTPPTPPSEAGWKWKKPNKVLNVLPLVAVTSNPHWTITIEKEKPAAKIALKPQEPVLFTVSNIITDLAPGITRMYLWFQNVPGFRDGILVAELEKTPLSYGAVQGEGLCVSAAGKLSSDKPPPLPYKSGLYVQQSGDGPAAIFNGGNVGIGTGTANPGSCLSVAGGVAIGTGYAQASKTAANDLAVEGKVGIGTNTSKFPLSFKDAYGDKISLFGQSGLSYGFGIQSYLLQVYTPDDKSHIAFGHGSSGSLTETMRIAGTGNVGIGTSTPGFPLTFKDALGDKISLYGQSGVSYGFGIQSSLLQVHTPDGASHIAFGHGSSGSLTETMRIAGNGNVGIGTNTPGFPLSFANSNGAKISFWGQDPASTNYGVGIQNNLLQVHTDGISSDVVFGYGSSAKFTEVMRVSGTHDLFNNKPNKSLGNMLLGGTSQNSMIFTLGFTGLAAGNSHAEISNDIFHDDYKALMLVGNGSRGTGRWVQVWDNLDVMGDLHVRGKIYNYFDGEWRYLMGYSGSYGYTCWSNSDLRLKKELQPVSSALDKVRQLRGVTFHWNDEALAHFTRDIAGISAGPSATETRHEEARNRTRGELARRNVGVVAQDVEAVLPEAVTTDASGHKSVRYDGLIPLLIEAVKEQERIAAAQQAEIERLKRAVGIS